MSMEARREGSLISVVNKGFMRVPRMWAEGHDEALEASQASAFLGAPLPQGGAGLPAEARSAKAGWKTAYPAPPTIRAAQRWLKHWGHARA